MKKEYLVLMIITFLLVTYVVIGNINAQNPNVPVTPGSVIRSLNNQTGQNQFFANDSNVIINSSNDIHTLGWNGTLPVQRGGTGATSFGEGSVLFSFGGKISENNANLFWDDVNARLGIGTTSPLEKLDVVGSIRTLSLTITGGATSTFANGIDISSGCFAIGGICIGDSGKVTTKFGGDGSDGELAISAGTFTIDLESKQVVIKNYTTISITGSGKLTFVNPHPNGTAVILKSQGDVTLTSSANPLIDLRLLGALGGNGGATSSFTLAAGGGGGGASVSNRGESGAAGFTGSRPGQDGKDGLVFFRVGGGRGQAGAGIGGLGGISPLLLSNRARFEKAFIAPGAGGGGGGGSVAGQGGAGGTGGGAMFMEVGDTLTLTGIINASGQNGGDGAGGGGGGGGGSVVILYNDVSLNAGAILTNEGQGGFGAIESVGGLGGNGYSVIAENTEF